MFTSIFSTQKSLIRIMVKESAKDQRIWRAKYNKFMRSRQPLIWSR